MPNIICGMTRNLIRSILCLFYDYSDVDDKILMVDKKSELLPTYFVTNIFARPI